MTITHHLDAATIVAYAAGTLDEALLAVAAGHVGWCARCRAAVREVEALGGELLDGLDAAVLSPGLRDATLARLEGIAPQRPSRERSAELPLALAQALGADRFADVRWRWIAPGAAKADVRLSAGSRGRLMLLKVAPGAGVPEHGHGGEELTLVLSGSYSDRFGRFGRGDVADLDTDVEHHPVADPGAACICAVAFVEPTRYRSLLARLVQPILGI